MTRVEGGDRGRLDVQHPYGAVLADEEADGLDAYARAGAADAAVALLHDVPAAAGEADAHPGIRARA